MYKHILVSTDGTERSARAIVEAMKLAKCCGAKVTALNVAPLYMPSYYGEAPLAAMASTSWCQPKEEHEANAAKVAAGHFDVVKREAQIAGVAAATNLEFNDSPSKAILDTAEKLHCDCIVMASHGRRGLEGLLIGSETNKVVTMSKVPVLVIR